MKKNQNSLDDLFAMILDTGDGAYLWKIFEAGPPLSGQKPDALSAEEEFSGALERFVHKHRFAIATAHSRFMIRKWCADFKTQPRFERSMGSLPASEPPINI